jgi:hypothetical protein
VPCYQGVSTIDMVDMFFINSHAELGEMMQVAFFVLASQDFSVWAQGTIAQDGPNFDLVDPQKILCISDPQK